MHCSAGSLLYKFDSNLWCVGDIMLADYTGESVIAGNCMAIVWCFSVLLQRLKGAIDASWLKLTWGGDTVVFSFIG